MQQALTEVPFKVIPPQSFYTVKGVPYGGAVVDVQVTTGLLNGGRPGTQREVGKTGWLGSGPLIYSLLRILHVHKDDGGVEELRQLFVSDFRMRVMTATGVT